MSKFKKLLIICGIAFICRMVFVGVFVDLESENYWEFGELGKNMLAGKGYSLFYQTEEGLGYLSKEDVSPSPSAYMPPGYPAVLAMFLNIDNVVLRNILIMGFHALLSCLVLILLYNYINSHFDVRSAVIGALIYALLPEFIYASSSYGSVIIYHIAVLSVLQLMHRTGDNPELSNYLILSIAISLTAYFRPEIFIFYFLFILIRIRKPEVKHIIISLALAFVIMLPWQIRNYSVFDEFVPFTTSGGQNFYRGHNPERPGIWCDDQMAEEIKTIKPGVKFELDLSKMYYKYAFEAIAQDPIREIGISFEKIFHLIIFNQYDDRSYNVLYIFPWMLLLAAGGIALFRYRNKRISRNAVLFIIFHIILAVIFFAIPRYQTMMKIILIPFAAKTISEFCGYLRNRYKLLVKYNCN